MSPSVCSIGDRQPEVANSPRPQDATGDLSKRRKENTHHQQQDDFFPLSFGLSRREEGCTVDKAVECTDSLQSSFLSELKLSLSSLQEEKETSFFSGFFFSFRVVGFLSVAR